MNSSTWKEDRDRALVLNERMGRLFCAERMKSNIEASFIERLFGLKPNTVSQWESGDVSPQANIFYQIINYLGHEAVQNFSELWLEIQIESYRFRQHVENRQ